MSAPQVETAMQYRLSIIEGGRTSVYGNEIIMSRPPGQCPCRTVSGIMGSLPAFVFHAEKRKHPAEHNGMVVSGDKVVFCGKNQYEP